MAQEAVHPIKGFLYQFNKALDIILQSDDETIITVEGIIEDIDTKNTTGITAIQVKYHESQKKFHLSLIYKPILQMMQHFCEHPQLVSEYRLYAYFPDKTSGVSEEINKQNLKQILASTNAELQKHIKKIEEAKVNFSEFLNRFKMEYGLKYNLLVKQVQIALEKSELSEELVPDLFYPNAFHQIAVLSTSPDGQRSITKKQLLTDLKKVETVTISRWTLALRNAKYILRKHRERLKDNLGKNARTRHFLISSDRIENFQEEIVTFIKDFVEKYHYKECHTKTPLFCLECCEETFNDAIERLYNMDIKAELGQVGVRYDFERLFREPLKKILKNQVNREFDIRLYRFGGDFEVLNYSKCDDLFVISNLDCSGIKKTDICFEKIDVSKLSHLKYLLGLSNVSE